MIDGDMENLDIKSKISDKLREIDSFSADTPPYKMRRLVEELVDLLSDYRKIHADDEEKSTRLEHAIDGILHTLDKEVGYMENSYDRMRKKNAAKVRRAEHLENIGDAQSMINMEIFGWDT